MCLRVFLSKLENQRTAIMGGKVCLILVALFIFQCHGETSNSPEECVPMKLSEAVTKNFKESMSFSLGPLEKVNENAWILQAEIVGAGNKRCEMTLIWDNTTRSLEVTCGTYSESIIDEWYSTAKWDILWLEMVLEESSLHKEGLSNYLRVVTANQSSNKLETSLKSPFKLHFPHHKKNENLMVFFDCSIECQIDPRGLEEIAGRTTFYIKRKDHFWGAKIFISGLTELHLLPEQIPDLNHWYEVSIKPHKQSIQVAIDGKVQPLINVPELLPRFDRMNVTLNGTAVASWCPKYNADTSVQSQIIAGLIMLLVMWIINILVCTITYKNNQEIQKITRERESKGIQIMTPMPNIFSEHSDRPFLPPPVNIKPREHKEVVLNDSYCSEPRDGLPQGYATLPGDIYPYDHLHQEPYGDLTDDEPYDKLHQSLPSNEEDVKCNRFSKTSTEEAYYHSPSTRSECESKLPFGKKENCSSLDSEGKMLIDGNSPYATSFPPRKDSKLELDCKNMIDGSSHYAINFPPKKISNQEPDCKQLIDGASHYATSCTPIPSKSHSESS